MRGCEAAVSGGRAGPRRTAIVPEYNPSGTAPYFSIGDSMAARDRNANARLNKYRDKRAPERTPEPFAYDTPAGGGQFVVQKHAATRMHYDLRLEHEGALLS